jgi:ABC-2 type transport system permease protein
MRNFLVQSYSNYKALFLWLNWPGYISGVLLQPFASVVMFSILGRFAHNPAAARDYGLGISVFSMAFVIMNGIAQSYSYDRMFGTISFVFVSRTNRLVNYLSRALFHYPNALLSFTCGLLASWAIAGVSFDGVNWTGLILSSGVIAFSLTGAGELLGVLSIAFRNWVAFQAMALGILLVLTGVVIPLTAFPGYVQRFAELLPMTGGLAAVKACFAGATLSQVSIHLVREGALGIAYFVVAYIGFLTFERRAKVTGALDRDGL